MKMAVSAMQTDWKEWISEAMIKECRRDLAKKMTPQVNKKGNQGKEDKEGVKLGRFSKGVRKEVMGEAKQNACGRNRNIRHTSQEQMFSFVENWWATSAPYNCGNPRGGGGL